MNGTFPEIKLPFQTGIIDIGSHTLRLDVYEIRSNWEPHLLETAARPLALGSDVFRNGLVSPDSVEHLTSLLLKCREKLSEYGVSTVRIVATSAIREAFNRELVADRLRSAGMELEILESSEEIALSCDAARKILQQRTAFSAMHALFVILGSGSLFIAFFDGGLMRFCEEIPIGTLRVADVFGSAAPWEQQLSEQIQSQRLRRRIGECVPLKPDAPVQLVLIGAVPRKLAGHLGQPPQDEEALSVFPAALAAPVLTAPPRQGSSLEEGAELAAAGAILRSVFEEWQFENVYIPGITTRSALVRDLIRKLRAPGEELPLEDIGAVCKAIGFKYGCDAAHAAQVTAISRKLFGKLKRNFSFPERAELLLSVSASLHDIGRFVDTRQHHKHSCYLISHTLLPGITARERAIIAATARYHRKALPRDSHPEYATLPPGDRVTVLKLAAILRVADALDSARCSRFENMKIVQREKTLYLQAPGSDFRAESFYLSLKSDLFQQVYGMTLQIREML